MTRALATLLALCALPATAVAQYRGANPARCPGMSHGEYEVYAYEVQAGDSCSRIATRLYGHRNRFDLIHRYNADMGPTPHQLRAGTHLCLPRTAPPRGETGPPAHITALRQNVRARPPEVPRWATAVLGQSVDRGARVDVRERAFAELTFRDTSTVILRGDTLVVVYGDPARTRRTATTAELERGSLRTRLGELRGRIRTPSSQVTLAGGSAVAAVDAEGTTRVSNHFGGPAEVADESGQNAVRVAENMGSEVRRGRRPSRPRPLPAAPSWATPRPARFLGVPQMTTVRGEWGAVENARVYRVEIARRSDGGELVAAVEVPAEVTRFEVHRLPAGTYYARASTINRGFFESRPSERWSFEVVIGGLDAPGGEPAAESASAFDFGDASEEPQPLRLWPGTRLTAPEGVTCAGGDDVELSTPGPVEVECVDAEGQPVGLFHGEVLQPAVTLADGGQASLPAGQTSRVTVLVAHADELPSAVTLVGSEGFEVVSSTRRADGYEVELRVSDAAREGHISLVVGDAELAGLDLMATAEEVVVPAPTPIRASAPQAPPTERLASEAFGTSLMPSLVGLRRARANGVGGWLAVAAHGADQGDVERVRGSLGVRAGLVERALQIEVATSYDFQGTYDRTAVQGSGDLWAAVAWAPTVDDLELTVELGGFFPTNPDPGGLGEVRLLPSLHLALPFDRFLFRTRQGLFVDFSDVGNVGWVSAYGVDVRLVGPLAIGAEIGLSLGQEDQDLLALGTVGGHVSVLAEHFAFSIAARGGLPDDGADVAGPWSVLFTVGVGGWPIDARWNEIPMHRFAPLTRTLALAAAAFCAAPAGPASAQAVHLDQYRSAETPIDGFALSRPNDLGHLRMGAQVHVDYALDPLVIEEPLGSADAEVAALVEHHLAAQATISFGLLDRLVLYAGLPVTLVMDGDEIPGEQPVEDAGIGDVMVGARGRLFGEAEDPFAIALAFSATFPTAQASNPTMRFSGEDGVALHPELLLEGRLVDGRLTITGNVGGRFRSTDRGRFDGGATPILEVSHELTWGLGLGFEVVEEVLDVRAEAYGVTTFEHFGRRESSPIELILGARVSPGDGLRVGLAGGLGLARGYGSPDFRGVITLGWSGDVDEEQRGGADRDGDGRPDAEDRCPLEPEDPDGWQDEDGCPDLDNDGDGVPDAQDGAPNEPEDLDGDRDEDGVPDADGGGVLVAEEDPEASSVGESGGGGTAGVGTAGGGTAGGGTAGGGTAGGGTAGGSSTGVADSDGDGVANDDDECPDDAEDADGHHDQDGCPDPDNDEDSILDADDQCPGEPGPASSGGCPTAVRLDISSGRIAVLAPVEFATNRDVILERSEPTLEAVRGVMHTHDEIRRVRIEGHTDDRGRARHNRDLSARRARSVMRWLVQHGVDAERLTAFGCGPAYPEQDNGTDAGRQANRRVEFLILDPPAQGQTTRECQAIE